jgi:hypothetical protein
MPARFRSGGQRTIKNTASGKRLHTWEPECPAQSAVFRAVAGLAYLSMSMHHRARPYLALATLAAFLLGQPAVGCAALCLFEQHVTAPHTMSDRAQGSAVLTNSMCHASKTGGLQPRSLLVLSPMAPASAPIVAVAPDRWTEPVWIVPSVPRLVSHSVEPPPPRLV